MTKKIISHDGVNWDIDEGDGTRFFFPIEMVLAQISCLKTAVNYHIVAVFQTSEHEGYFW
jgi:hypothetical protein